MTGSPWVWHRQGWRLFAQPCCHAGQAANKSLTTAAVATEPLESLRLNALSGMSSATR